MLSKTDRGGGYSEIINMLRFPLAVLVVFIHSFGPDIILEELHVNDFDGNTFYNYFRILISVVISRSAVPLFFMISGYLLFFKVKDYSVSVYQSIICKRFYSLIVPYFVWIIIFILWSIAFKIGGILLYGKSWISFFDYFHNNGYWHMFWDSSVWGERINLWGIKTYKSGPVLLPFWYMRDLILMVIFSPFIYFLVKKIKMMLIICSLIVYAFDIRVSWMSTTITTAFFFFSFGAYLAIMKRDFLEELWKWKYMIYLFAFALMFWQTYTGSSMGDEVSLMIHPWLIIVQSLAIIILASTFCKYTRIYEFNCRLAKTSFFIYALHPFILGNIISLLDNIMPLRDSWYMKLFNYCTAPLLCISICLSVYWILKKYFPGILTLLVGERKRVGVKKM